MCTFKATLISLKSLEHLDVMQGYGTTAGSCKDPMIL